MIPSQECVMVNWQGDFVKLVFLKVELKHFLKVINLFILGVIAGKGMKRHLQ